VEIYLFILSYGMEPEGCGLIRRKKEESKARKAKQKKRKHDGRFLSRRHSSECMKGKI
jgi:hypothetical protein